MPLVVLLSTHQLLLDAVNDGTLSGAAIDTYENEADYFTYD